MGKQWRPRPLGPCPPSEFGPRERKAIPPPPPLTNFSAPSWAKEGTIDFFSTGPILLGEPPGATVGKRRPNEDLARIMANDKKPQQWPLVCSSTPHISYWNPTYTHEDSNGAEKIPQFHSKGRFPLSLLLNVRGAGGGGGEVKFDEPLELIRATWL